jgi:mRNA-degrading endonuclease RelE of RelBE toxin-antitoxin system
MATVRVTPQALEQIDRLPAEIVARVERLFARLEKWPAVSGAKALSGPLAGHRRLRTGDYRVQFRVEGESVIVEKVGHRDKFYEE